MVVEKLSNNLPSSKPLDLNKDEDYYSNAAGWQYMSVSQYKDFLKCEAAALAKLKEEWEPTSDPKALLVGNYVHSYFETPEAHTKFKEEHGDKLYKKNGDLYRDFEIAEQMINRIKDEPFFNFLWQGEKEVPVTGQLFSVEWKGKIDLLNVEEGYFVDLKTTRSLDNKIWDPQQRRYVSFVEGYGYVIQLGIYEKLLEMEYGKPFVGYIYAVTKETPSNIAAIEVPEIDKGIELDFVKERVQRVEAVKTGQEEPEMCGKCEFCRGRKELTGFIQPSELID